MSEENGLRLLLTHLERWADQRNRPIDMDVLESLLELRSSYTGLPPTSWPSGSVNDLLLELWPAKGEGSTPDPDAVAQSFDTFVRFLRNTGRMAGGSADPNDLAREARRAALRMGETNADRSQWSTGKVLTDHARKLGLDLNGAESLDDQQALEFGVYSGIGIIFALMSRWGDACGLLYALLRSYLLGCERVSWDEIGAFLDSPRRRVCRRLDQARRTALGSSLHVRIRLGQETFQHCRQPLAFVIIRMYVRQ